MLALIVILGLIAQWVAWRLRLPAIVMLALTGIIAGPVLGVLDPHTQIGPLLEPVIKLGVAIILFEGGLNLELHELRTAATAVRRLTTWGVALAWALGSLAAHYIGGMQWPVALVFGAIIVVTGPTVIMPLLRQANLERRPASLLKWEGIVNDPIGALLAVIVFQYFAFSEGGNGVAAVAGSMLLAVIVAAAVGAALGWGLGRAFLRGWVPEYLKGPLMVATALLAYVLANLVQEEAGLLATTVMGVMMGNMPLRSLEELRRFKEYITVMLVSAVFILLTATLDMDVLTHLDARSLLLLAAILFLVRPTAVLLATLRSGIELRERALVAWIAPRGIVAAAVAGVFAGPLVERGYTDAERLVPLVFALIFLTVVVHGFTIGFMARALGLAAQRRNRLLIVGASEWSTEFARTLHAAEIPVLLVDETWERLRKARFAGLPVHHGQILAEVHTHYPELNDVALLLAADANLAYNALVCTRFAGELGRQNTFQLVDRSGEEGAPRGYNRGLSGIPAFDEGFDFGAANERLARGWRFQRTRLTEDWTYDDFAARLPAGAVVLARFTSEGQLRLTTPRRELAYEAGDLVIAFVPPEEQPPSAVRDKARRDRDGVKPATPAAAAPDSA